MTATQQPDALPFDAASMPHQAFIRRRGEDWAGITNQTERKRLQNRLNQRAPETQAHQGRERKALAEAKAVVLRKGFVPSHADAIFTDITDENIEQIREALHRFAYQALTSYAKHEPRADHLLQLIQLNVINSFTRNADVLGLRVDWLVCSSLSPFGLPSTVASDGSPSSLPACPENLAPTALQRRVPHTPWIDLLPLPRMRDNFLVALSQILTHAEEQRLWDDLIESGGEKNWTGMIVWGEPWDPRNWEVTWPFLQTWGWLLQGCEEIVSSTNYWRRRRGQRSIDPREWWSKEQAVCFTHTRREICDCDYHRMMAELSCKALENRVDGE